MSDSATIQIVKRQTRPFVPTKPFAPVEAQVQRAISRIADSDCPVLIVGERGVGKAYDSCPDPLSVTPVPRGLH